MMSEFEKRLRDLLNSMSAENESDTPDFILAEYLANCLASFNSAVDKREGWYGRGGCTCDQGWVRHQAPHKPPGVAMASTACEKCNPDGSRPDPFDSGEVAVTTPVCARCNDTHLVTSHEEGRQVMCTSCPTPCGKCRGAHGGAFCATTPCTCECHGD